MVGGCRRHFLFLHCPPWRWALAIPSQLLCNRCSCLQATSTPQHLHVNYSWGYIIVWSHSVVRMCVPYHYKVILLHVIFLHRPCSSQCKISAQHVLKEGVHWWIATGHQHGCVCIHMWCFIVCGVYMHRGNCKHVWHTYNAMYGRLSQYIGIHTGNVWVLCVTMATAVCIIYT